MKGWQRLLLAAIAAAALSLWAWHALPPREPSYQGRPLSAWVDSYYESINPGAQIPNPGEPVLDANAVAIQQIGTNAIPYVLNLVQTEDSPAKRFLLSHFLLPRMLTEKIARLRWFSQWAAASMMQPHKGWLAFRVLGPKGEAAIPALVCVLQTSPNPHSRRSAVYSLGAIGPLAERALPDLMTGFRDANMTVRDATVSTTFEIAFNREKGQFRPDCSRVITPLLVELLRDPKTDVLRVIRILTDIGPDARAAIPALTTFAHHENSGLRDAAVIALKRIDPGGVTLESAKSNDPPE